MKKLISPVLLLAFIQFPVPPEFESVTGTPVIPVENIFIVTLDGFRWQEVFTGADSLLINNEMATPDAGTVKLLYWDTDPEQRRKKLLPFFWNVLAEKGQLYGNRLADNKVNVANGYAISYPGYNEIFTGTTDMSVSSNKKIPNPNINILEYLDAIPAFKGKVAAFTSWDVFPYIFNTTRNKLRVNSGYDNREENLSASQKMINNLQSGILENNTGTRYDELTFLTAKAYIQKTQPRVVFIGLGETDEWAHAGRYDMYLEKANQADKMIAVLWHWIQTTPGYKDNSTLIITTDHGRGSRTGKWTSHGNFIKGSSQTWLGIMGPHLSRLGELKNKGQLYQQQLAQTIALSLGEDFPQSLAPPITLR